MTVIIGSVNVYSFLRFGTGNKLLHGLQTLLRALFEQLLRWRALRYYLEKSLQLHVAPFQSTWLTSGRQQRCTR